jgi:hypothetical protein
VSAAGRAASRHLKGSLAALGMRASECGLSICLVEPAPSEVERLVHCHPEERERRGIPLAAVLSVK